MTGAAEGLVVGGAGAALAWAALSSISALATLAVAVGVAAAGLNGLIAGAVGIYAWRTGRGWLCFLLDSTWGLPGIIGGVLLNAANLFHPARSYVREMSVRCNRHVYERGFSARPGFVLALGNVVSGGSGEVGLRGDSPRAIRRRKLVDVHEGLHLFQNRAFGPLYALVYASWMILAGAAGLVVGMLRDRRHLWSVIETFAYYNNPFEYWAYRKDDYWPPRGAHPAYVWRSLRDPVATD